MRRRDSSTALRPKVAVRFSAVFFLILLGIIGVALTVGRYDIDVRTLLRLVLPGSGSGDLDTARDILFNIRLPRILMAAFVGAGLSVAGVIFRCFYAMFSPIPTSSV